MKMRQSTLISVAHWMWACLLLGLESNAPAHSLVIKHEPQLDTELYVAPATYTRKDGKALPSTIIISRPIGVRDKPEKKPFDDFPEDSFTFISSDDDSKEGNIGLKHNIKFYKIECTSGRPCSSIIPAHTTTPPPLNLKPMTDEEIKEYLDRFNLRNGFQYTDDFESSGSPSIPVESDFDVSEERAFGGNSYSQNNYWPGSRFRPRPQPSRGQVFKYQQISGLRKDQLSQDPGRLPSLTWDSISSDLPSRPDTNTRPSNTRPYSHFPPHKSSRPSRPENNRPQGVLRPATPNDDTILQPYGPPRPSPPPRVTTRPYDGVWNRYSMSTVSQLDRDTGKWVKISSSNAHLDQGTYDDFPKPSSQSNPATHHASASLTVLGVNDRQPHAFTESGHKNSHTVEVPSAIPGSPPETIETDGGYVHGVASVPLTVLQPGELKPSSSVDSIPSTGFAHVSVPLYLISTPNLTAALSDEPTNTTTSSTTTTTTTTTVTTTTTTTARPPPTTARTTPRTTTQPSPQAPSGFFDNPSAVMAAVGAGLIPATFAALLPVFVGGRRRRRRRSDGLWEMQEVVPEKQVTEVVERVWRALGADHGNNR